MESEPVLLHCGLVSKEPVGGGEWLVSGWTGWRLAGDLQAVASVRILTGLYCCRRGVASPAGLA